MTDNPVASKAKRKDDNLTTLVQYFEDSEEATRDARLLSERDRDYYDGKQYTADEKAKLLKRGQPALVFNKIKRKVNFLTGHEDQTKADPKAYPRNYPADEDGAQAATDALRYVQQDQLLEDKFSTTFEHMNIEGYGGIEVLYNAKKDKMDIKVWPWDRLFYDPYSARPDFSDGKYRGGVVWMDEDDAKGRYKGKGAIIDATISSHTEGTSETHDDKPRQNWARLGSRKRIRVVQIYWKNDGDWWWAHFTKGGILEGNMPVIFKDEDGETECPLVMQSAYVDRDNCRYGEIRELIDIQDEVNKRRVKLLYQLGVRQVRADKGAVDNVNKAREQVARPDGWIETNPNKEFEIIQNSDQSSGQAQLLQEAKSEMEFAGPNASLMGDTRSGASGRAIIASQQGGLTELGRFLARYRNFKLRVYRQIWNRVRQFWTAEKWVRVTDDEKNVKFVGLNIPETVEDVLLAQMKQEEDDPEQIQEGEEQLKALGPEQIMKLTSGQFDSLSAPTGKLKNNVAEMDMDIIIDEAPDTVTIQQEQFEQIVALGRSGIEFEAEDIIELSQLRNKDQVIERMSKRKAASIPPEVQELQMRDGVAEVEKKEASAAKDAAQAEKTEIETAGMALELGTNVGLQ